MEQCMTSVVLSTLIFNTPLVLFTDQFDGGSVDPSCQWRENREAQTSPTSGGWWGWRSS